MDFLWYFPSILLNIFGSIYCFFLNVCPYWFTVIMRFICFRKWTEDENLLSSSRKSFGISTLRETKNINHQNLFQVISYYSDRGGISIVREEGRQEKESWSTLVIKHPKLEDQGTYTCRPLQANMNMTPNIKYVLTFASFY